MRACRTVRASRDTITVADGILNDDGPESKRTKCISTQANVSRGNTSGLGPNAVTIARSDCARSLPQQGESRSSLQNLRWDAGQLQRLEVTENLEGYWIPQRDTMIGHVNEPICSQLCDSAIKVRNT